MGANRRGSGDGSPPAGSRGRALVGVWGRSPPEAEEFFEVVTSKYYAFFVAFYTFSPMYAYVFFRACRHHSTKSAKWGSI